MPIFELDAGRPVLVQPMQPAAGAFEAETQALVADHLGSLLNEQIFPVVRGQGGPTEPQVLALDAHGQPVVAEVVRVLDGEGLVRALRHAGAASRLSTDDLERAYVGGPHAFADDLRTFRESLPIAVRNAPGQYAGARVVIFCAEVAENVLDAIEFLRQPGRQLDILQVGVVRGNDGRRLLEVSPLGTHAPARRPVEPPPMRLVQPQDAFAAVMAYDERRSENPGRRLLHPEPAFALGTPPLGAQQRVDGDDDTQRAAATGHRMMTGQNLRVPPAPRTDSIPVVASRADSAPVVADPIPVVAEPPVRVPTAERLLQETIRRDQETAELAAGPLVAIANTLGSTTLVWIRERRGERFEALLRADGMLQLADGQVFDDPDAAATAVSGSSRQIDGWGTWRIGDHGQTLREAAGRP
jgi:hypothetical protein